ncbi:hypothetical protein BH23PSE1_BH23PSE1_10380 [soil metagenome]
MHHDHEPGPDDERIRERAFEIWDQEGRPEDRAEDHWAQAEAELGGGGAFGAAEQPGGGRPEAGSGLSEAEAQPGEGVPGGRSTPEAQAGGDLADERLSEADAQPGGRPETGREESEQPLAASPADGESEALFSDASPGRKTRGKRTGP